MGKKNRRKEKVRPTEPRIRVFEGYRAVSMPPDLPGWKSFEEANERLVELG
tara:strand:- start:129 stop:281 length:153 start_codon:yes stop_codon:yes gene_type:complete